jgi:hypothetical protein
VVGGRADHATLARWPALPQAQVREDALAHGRILEHGDEAQLAAAAAAPQNVLANTRLNSSAHASRRARPGSSGPAT